MFGPKPALFTWRQDSGKDRLTAFSSRTAIIAAMPGELKPFLDQNAKEGWVHEKRGNVHLWRLTWPDDQGEWIAACAGAGQQAATHAFAEVEKDGPITSAISVGWVGALTEEAKPGKAYKVSEVVDSRTGERFQVAQWSEECLLVTSPTVADAAEKQRLAAAYNAALVDMEATAVARLAAMRGIPFYCCKGVSDGFSEDLIDFNRFITPDGQFKMGKLLIYVLPRPWHWPALIRMGENSKHASQSIAECLFDFLDERGHIRKRNGYPNF
jgi:adenosylhomocysteine nucleosidase